MTLNRFHAVYDEVLPRIEQRGYRKPPNRADAPDLDAGGLDRSCRSLTQLFYWPCANQACLEGLEGNFDLQGIPSADSSREDPRA